MSLENRGIPTVVICTGPFMNSAHLQARTFGRPGFQPVSIAHPLGGLDASGVIDRATSVTEQIIAVLTSGE